MNKLIATLLMSVALALTACSDLPVTWPRGHVPYRTLGFSVEENMEIYRCMLQWEAVSGGKVKFVNVDLAKDKDLDHDLNPVMIVKLDSMGNVYGGTPEVGPQETPMVFLCNTDERTILHELGHVLGLGDEHRRPDRDLYITIDWNHWLFKSQPLLALAFIPLEPEAYDYARYPYDYKSVMHYESLDGAIDAGEHTDIIGQGGISVIDAMKIRDMYN